MGPVGHAAGEELVEGFGVVVVFEVAELVDDDVLDAVDGGLDEGQIEGDAALGGTASPAGVCRVDGVNCRYPRRAI